MSLRKAGLPIQFSGGVELRQDSKQVPTTRLIDLQNGIFTKQTSIQKRNGYAARATPMDNPRGIASRGREILRFSDKRAESYQPIADTWADAGEIAATTATTLPIARSGTFQTGPDVADQDGVRVVAWEDSRGGVWCEVFDSTTGHVLLGETQLDNAALARRPRCVACGPQDLAVLWTREDQNRILSAHVDTTNPSRRPSLQIFADDLDPLQPFFDAEYAPNAPTTAFSVRPACAAWVKAGGGFRVGYVNAQGVIGTPLTGVASSVSYPDIVTGPIAVTWDPVVGVVAICWISGAAKVAVRFVLGNALNTTVRTTTALGAGAPSYSRLTATFGAGDAAGVPILYWAAESGTTRTDLTFVDSGAANRNNTALDAASTRLRGHGLVSRAWHDGATLAPTTATIDGEAYVMVAYTVRFFPYVAALRLSDTSGINSPGNTVVARLMPGEASGSIMHVVGAARVWSAQLPSVIALDLGPADFWARQHAAPIPYRIQLSSQNGDQFSEQGIKLATLDFDVVPQTVEFGRGLYMASAAIQHYDGAQWREADFHTAPDLGFDAAGNPVALSTAITIAGAGAIGNGTYLYAFWYEAIDAQGEIHRGAVSVKVLVTMVGGPKKFSIVLPTCRLTRFATSRICVARSAQGATGTDSTLPLFKVTANDATVTVGDNRFVTNDFNVDTVTFVDNLSDALLVAREPLYTNGGILSNDPAPSSGRAIAVAKNRLLWTDSTDLNLVRHSQVLEDDTALQGPIGLSVAVDAFGGPITAIGSLDDLIVPFKRDAIFGFAGPGPLSDPTVDPATNSFSAAERITSDMGCLSGTSLGDSPLGVVFISSKGIKLLSRARQVVDIGNPVESLATTQHFTRTTLLPDRKAIIFLTDTTEGFTLFWDYDRNQWSKFSNHVGLGSVVVDGKFFYMREDGRLYEETIGQYLDDTRTIQLQIETAWIHFAQYLQGWQKILWAYWLGEHISNHTLSVQFRLDYNTAYSEPLLSDVNNNIVLNNYGDNSYGNNSYGGPGNVQRYQRRNHINRRCQAISFLIKDVDADGGGIVAPNGASFELSELLVIGGGVGPDFKPGASRSR